MPCFPDSAQHHRPTHNKPPLTHHAAELVDRFLDQRVDLLLLRHVARSGERGDALAAQLRDSLRRRLRVDVGDDHLGARRAEAVADGEADALGAARHDRDAVEQRL